jgi:hypothetical protein
MKKVVVSALAALLAATAIADFSGDFSVENWTSNGVGSVDVSLAPASISITSPDDGSGDDQNELFTITAPTDATISFDWSYVTTDMDSSYDPFWILENAADTNTFIQLTDDAGEIFQSGDYTFSVSEGQTFGFRANSEDSSFGAATTIISNFNAVIPEPEALGMIVIAGASLLGIRRIFSI